MDKLFVPISLDPLHQRINLKLLLLPNGSLILVCRIIYRFLMFLDFFYFHLVGEYSKIVRFSIFFDREVSLLLGSESAALFTQRKDMVLCEDLLACLNQFDVVLLSHFPQALVGSCLIILHVHVPGVRKLYELLSLYALDFGQLNLLALLHLANLPH